MPLLQGVSFEQSLVEVDAAYRLMYNLAADLWCEAWLLFKRARQEGTLLVAAKVRVGRRGGEGTCWSHPRWGCGGEGLRLRLRVGVAVSSLFT